MEKKTPQPEMRVERDGADLEADNRRRDTS